MSSNPACERPGRAADAVPVEIPYGHLKCTKKKASKRWPTSSLPKWRKGKGHNPAFSVTPVFSKTESFLHSRRAGGCRPLLFFGKGVGFSQGELAVMKLDESVKR
jgi:hypothetical protein